MRGLSFLRYRDAQWPLIFVAAFVLASCSQMSASISDRKRASTGQQYCAQKADVKESYQVCVKSEKIACTNTSYGGYDGIPGPIQNCSYACTAFDTRYRTVNKCVDWRCATGLTRYNGKCLTEAAIATEKKRVAEADQRRKEKYEAVAAARAERPQFFKENIAAQSYSANSADGGRIFKYWVHDGKLHSEMLSFGSAGGCVFHRTIADLNDVDFERIVDSDRKERPLDRYGRTQVHLACRQGDWGCFSKSLHSGRHNGDPESDCNPSDASATWTKSSMFLPNVTPDFKARYVGP